jgi:hypothetical protein
VFPNRDYCRRVDFSGWTGFLQSSAEVAFGRVDRMPIKGP